MCDALDSHNTVFFFQVTYGLKDIAAPVAGGFICRVALSPAARIHLLPSDLWAPPPERAAAAAFPWAVSEGLQVCGIAI